MMLKSCNLRHRLTFCRDFKLQLISRKERISMPLCECRTWRYVSATYYSGEHYHNYWVPRLGLWQTARNDTKLGSAKTQVTNHFVCVMTHLSCGYVPFDDQWGRTRLHPVPTFFSIFTHWPRLHQFLWHSSTMGMQNSYPGLLWVCQKHSTTSIVCTLAGFAPPFTHPKITSKLVFYTRHESAWNCPKGRDTTITFWFGLARKRL